MDSHVTGTFLPLESYEVWIDRNGCDAAQVEPLAADLGLPVGDDSGPQADSEPWRREDAFDFREHLHEALLGVLMGVYWFELEGEIRDGLWRMVRLDPRPPKTIREVRSDPQTGALVHLRQDGAKVNYSGGLGFVGSLMQAPPIPAVRTVPYVWRPDASRRWEGRALLRPLYRNWLLKDVLVRLDVTNHEKAGGIPGFETDESYAGASLDRLAQLASEMKLDEEGGWASPPGAKAKMLLGKPTDIVASIRYHDEQIGKVWHQMVRELGQTQTGSRALGETFGDLEVLARRAIMDWALRTFTRGLIYRWWLWNYGEQPTAPILRSRPPGIEGSDTPEPVVPAEPSPAPPVAERLEEEVTAAWAAGVRPKGWRGCAEPMR